MLLYPLLKDTFEAEIGTFQHIVIFDSKMISLPPWVMLLTSSHCFFTQLMYSWLLTDLWAALRLLFCCLRYSRCLLFSVSQQFKSTHLFEPSIHFQNCWSCAWSWGEGGGAGAYSETHKLRGRVQPAQTASLFILFMWCHALTEERYIHMYI